jgi:hypothetical protein
LDRLSQYCVGVAAEAFAAGLLAHAGCDVSVQYGANQPEYDLMAVREDKAIKISVKGSQDGAWGLSQSHLKHADYHGAAEVWLKKQKPRVVYMLVQFKDVKLGECPRVYLATPDDILKRLNESRDGHGETILMENHTWTVNSKGHGTTDKIPVDWKFSMERLNEMFRLKSI